MGGSENGRTRVLRVVIERPCVKKKTHESMIGGRAIRGVGPHLRHLGRCPPTAMSSKTPNKYADAYEKHGHVYMATLGQLGHGPAG